MHAILVTFRREASEQEAMQGIGPKMEQIVGTTPGLIMKTLVAPDPETWGGFYLFTTPDTANGYLEGEFFQWLSKTPLFSNVKVQHFHVQDDPSKAFGTPSVPLAASAAA